MSVRTEVVSVWRSFSRGEKRKVQIPAKYAKDARFRIRCLIIVNLVRQASPTEIAKMLNCSRTLVYNVSHRFIDQGLAGLVDRREDNGEPFVSEDVIGFLKELVMKTPSDYGYQRSTWSLELIVAILKEELEVVLSRGHLGKVCAANGICYRRPKPIVLCTWKKGMRTRRLNQIQQLLDNIPPGHVVLYVDEVDIHLNPKIGPDWTLKGHQKTVVTPGKNEKRYLAGALNAVTGETTWVESDKKDSDLFIDQLWTLVQTDYPEAKRIHLILDNYSIHSSKRTNIAVEALKDKISLHFLPPYCPDHNKIERLWKDLHANVTRNHRQSSISDLMVQVRQYLNVRKSGKHQYVTAP